MDKLVKPVKPTAPLIGDFPLRDKLNAATGQMVKTREPYFEAHNKYVEDLAKYYVALEEYEQMKLIRLIKNANPKLILRKYKITKR